MLSVDTSFRLQTTAHARYALSLNSKLQPIEGTSMFLYSIRRCGEDMCENAVFNEKSGKKKFANLATHASCRRERKGPISCSRLIIVESVVRS